MWLITDCWSFTSWQHLRSYQDVYWLMTVHTHVALLGNQPASNITQYPTQSHFPGTEPNQSLAYHVNAERLGSNKYQLNKSSVWLDWEPNSRSPVREAHGLPIRPLHSLAESIFEITRCSLKWNSIRSSWVKWRPCHTYYFVWFVCYCFTS